MRAIHYRYTLAVKTTLHSTQLTRKLHFCIRKVPIVKLISSGTTVTHFTHYILIFLFLWNEAQQQSKTKGNNNVNNSNNIKMLRPPPSLTRRHWKIKTIGLCILIGSFSQPKEQSGPESLTTSPSSSFVMKSNLCFK